MFMEFYSMEKKYCSTLLERDTSSFSQAIFVIYEHVLMKIVLLTTMTGFKQLIPVRDKAVEGKVKLLNYFGFHPKI